MNKKILVSGGPVHAHLDAVKIITNKFRGGRMAEIADILQEKGMDVTYLASKEAVLPEKCGWIEHNGYSEYSTLIEESAPIFDGMILGAAVCNLIPKNPWKEKFPSHLYKESDTIPIEFTIAPRVINKVKAINPKIHLFGFKLLSNVPNEELISAAYDVVIDSKANAIFANDAINLDQKYAVTKERSVIPMNTKEMVDFIVESMNDEYFQTIFTLPPFPIEKYVAIAKDILRFVGTDKFVVQQNGYIFGTIAVRIPESPGSFITTSRGKKELDDFTFVAGVDIEQGKVYAGPLKATLNAPLLSRIFTAFNDVYAIVHWHNTGKSSVPVLPYAAPGTRRDCQRPISDLSNGFEIEHHGCFELLRH